MPRAAGASGNPRQTEEHTLFFRVKEFVAFHVARHPEIQKDNWLVWFGEILRFRDLSPCILDFLAIGSQALRAAGPRYLGARTEH